MTITKKWGLGTLGKDSVKELTGAVEMLGLQRDKATQSCGVVSRSLGSRRVGRRVVGHAVRNHGPPSGGWPDCQAPRGHWLLTQVCLQMTMALSFAYVQCQPLLGFCPQNTVQQQLKVGQGPATKKLHEAAAMAQTG